MPTRLKVSQTNALCIFITLLYYDSSQAPGTPVRLMKGLKILKNIKNNKVDAVCNSEKKQEYISSKYVNKQLIKSVKNHFCFVEKIESQF